MPQVPIVGMRHHRPAKALTDNLPLGTRLILRAEPTNAWDENAIQVLVPTSAIPDDEALFGEALSSYGFTLTEVLSWGEVMLGYVPKELAAVLKSDGFPNGRDIEGEFTVSGASGSPQARFQTSWGNLT